MRKIYGSSHGINDWTNKYFGLIDNGVKINESDAKDFLSQIENIDNFPSDAYVDLASQIKYLSDKRIKIDMFNPGNLIIDNENKKLKS